MMVFISLFVEFWLRDIKSLLLASFYGCMKTVTIHTLCFAREPLKFINPQFFAYADFLEYNFEPCM